MGASSLRRSAICLGAFVSLAAASVWTIGAPPTRGQPLAAAHQSALLSPAERQQFVELRNRLDKGELTPENFAAQVDQLLGDRFPGRDAAAGGDGPLARRAAAIRRMFQRVSEKLDLSSDQKAAARDSLQSTRRQARLLAIENMARMRQILTPEQRSRFDQLRADRFASLRESAAGDRQAAKAAGSWRERAHAFVGRLADDLKLTTEQRTQLKSVRDSAKDQFRALGETTRAQLKKLLSPEQLQKLEQLRDRARSRDSKTPRTDATQAD